MILQFPSGRLELRPDPDAVVIVAVPRDLRVTRIRTFPDDTHRAVVLPAGETLRMEAPLQAFLAKHDAYRSNARLFLATAIFLMHRGARSVSSLDVRESLEAIGHDRVPQPAVLLGALVKRGFCARIGRGTFQVTAAGQKAFAQPGGRLRTVTPPKPASKRTRSRRHGKR